MREPIQAQLDQFRAAHRRCAAFPTHLAIGNIKGALFDFEPWVRARVMQIGRDEPVLGSQASFDEPGHTRGAIQMTDVRFG